MPAPLTHLRRLLHTSALCLGLLAASAQAQWLPGPDFNGARMRHTATPLPGGGVLLAGGSDGAGPLASTVRHDGGTGQWTAAAPLPEPRADHTGTPLRNGTVLIAGGTSTTGGPLRTAYTYDPQDDAFTPVPNLAVARRQHTATVLRDGRVLIAGGQGGAGQAALRSAEIYDPPSRTWSSADQMPGQGARHHTATLLLDGRVLVVAGMDNHENATTTTALYDPASNTWSAATPLPTGEQRMHHTATLLPDGRVYIAGGESASGAPVPGLPFIYDPAGGTWTAAAGIGERKRHSATLLPDGRVLMAGGAHAGTGGLHLGAVYYNPATNVAALSGAMTQARAGHTATLLPGGRVLVVGGQGASGPLTAPETLWPGGAPATRNLATRPTVDHAIATPLADGTVLVAGGLRNSNGAPPLRYDPVGDAWASAGTPAVGWRQFHTQTLLADGRVLAAGGQGTSDTLASAELYAPVANTWAATPDMAQPRHYHTATLLPGGGVLAAGGRGVVNDAASTLAQAEVYQPAQNRWVSAAPMPAPRAFHTATLLKNGRVLVAGGLSAAGQLASAALYDPAANTWTAAASMLQARNGHSATLLADGRVLVAGGYGGSYLNSAEIYDPATDTWGAVPTMSEAHAYHTATLLPDGRVLVAGGWRSGVAASGRMELFDPLAGTWASHALPQARRYHAAVLLASGEVLLTGGYYAGVGQPDQPISIQPQPNARAVRPAITNNFTQHDPGAPLQLIGTRFTGDGEAASGGTQQSASNAPQVRIERLDGGPVLWLDALMSGDTGYTSRPLPAWLPAGLYQARVFSNAIASSAYTFALRAPAAGAPGAPTGVTATPGNARVTVSWQHPAGGATPTSYTVTAQPGGASCTVQHPATSCTVTGLTNGTAYTFTVTANAEGGSASAPPSDPATPTAGVPDPLLNPPTGVTATPGNAQATVAWQVPASGTPPERYTVIAQPGGASCTVQAPATTCAVAGLVNGTAYTFVVTAHAGNASAAAPPAGPVTPSAGPAPVPGVQAVPTLGLWGVLVLPVLMLMAGMRRRAFSS